MKAKELDELKRSYKEGMDELSTLRTKVCRTYSVQHPGEHMESCGLSVWCPAAEVSRG